jgi:cytochrome c peroxidase
MRKGGLGAFFFAALALLSPVDAQAPRPETGVTAVPLGLPPLPIPPASPALIALGRALFFDTRLSANDTMSCGLCHLPEDGYSENQTARAVGIYGATLKRHPPSLYNVVYQTLLFWDGRETALETQIFSPLLAADEMGMPSAGFLLARIDSIPAYHEAFRIIFGAPPSLDRLGAAIAAFERSLLCGNSPFDRWFYGHDPRALDAAAIRGFTVFTGKGGCSACHRVGRDDALFTDGALHDTGLAYAERQRAARERPGAMVVLGGGLESRIDPVALGIGVRDSADLGRFAITHDPRDRDAFKTPSLRDVAELAPYMHDGSLPDLAAVIDFYDRGGGGSPTQDRRIFPRHFTPGEKADLLAFLAALSCAPR